MPRPFTLAQARENERFLAILRQTGNARFAAREIGRRISTLQHRRGAHAGFAQDWEAAVAAANAAFHLAGGRRSPEGRDGTGKGQKCLGSARQGLSTSLETNGIGHGANSPRSPALRTRGGELIVVRSQNGKLQLRFAHPDKLTKAAEQAFLAALSATANVRLSAAAAGASPAAFYRRRRRDPAFAREYRLALKMGWERLECALLAAGLPESHAHDAWRHNNPPPIPPLSADQALQLLFLHEKSVQQGWDMPHRRRRRGESDEIYSKRLGAFDCFDKLLRHTLVTDRAGHSLGAALAKVLTVEEVIEILGQNVWAGTDNGEFARSEPDSVRQPLRDAQLPILETGSDLGK